MGDKEYAKYVAVIPLKIIKKAKLKEGDELEINIRKDKIIINKKQ